MVSKVVSPYDILLPWQWRRAYAQAWTTSDSSPPPKAKGLASVPSSSSRSGAQWLRARRPGASTGMPTSAQEAAPYAIAVKAAGEGLPLGRVRRGAAGPPHPTDPPPVRLPRRIRRDVGQGVTVLGMRREHHALRGRTLPARGRVIRAAAPRLGRERAHEAARTAQHGYRPTSGEWTT